ncbi:hypothetical protein BDM02DRAFT_3115837 [Thelephora ganbajun]|uniref:Uncharacterized protein n=1 Tax=Thelephora ganbajun TaxID=370292 RepID=A0ACB6ZF29_THEGA|nr:hypothetical protein BDM02DRAFT_3115837 [Thelephora ganbajun]
MLGDPLQEGGDDVDHAVIGETDPVDPSDPLISEIHRCHCFSVGKDFDLFRSAFFANDAPMKPSTQELQQNTFDRDPLLVISNICMVATGWPLRLLDGTVCERCDQSGAPGQHAQVQQQLPLSSSVKFFPFEAAEALHQDSPHVSRALT